MEKLTLPPLKNVGTQVAVLLLAPCSSFVPGVQLTDPLSLRAGSLGSVFAFTDARERELAPLPLWGYFKGGVSWVLEGLLHIETVVVSGKSSSHRNSGS